jgi:CDP-glucose 4,6-dehydratase
VIADVRDAEVLAQVVDEADPDVIFHLAAQPLVRESYRNPAVTVATNVMGTVNLLEAVRARQKPCAVVVVTSDKCYENREWVYGYRESDPMGGHDPYSMSKGAAELVVASWRQSFFPPVTLDRHGICVATVRAGNVIGGGDWGEDRLLPDAVRAVESGRTLRVRSPGAVRPWQHVLNPLAGYLMLAERLCESAQVARAWNFGPPAGEARTVGRLVERLGALWEGELTWQLDDAANPPEAEHLELDSTAAREQLGWRPRWGLEEALAQSVDWHRRERRGEDVRAQTLDALERFTAGRPPRALDSPTRRA